MKPLTQTRSEKQAKRLSIIREAVSKHEEKACAWERELDEINEVVSALPDSVIKRIQERNNGMQDKWWITEGGYFRLLPDFGGFLMSLDDLAELIVDALK